MGAVNDAMLEFNRVDAEMRALETQLGFNKPWLWEKAPWHPWAVNPYPSNSRGHARWLAVQEKGREIEARWYAARDAVVAANKQEGI